MSDKLKSAMATVVARQEQAKNVRERIHARSRAQLDSIHGVIEEVEDHVEAGQGGGVFGYRQLKTLLHERKRLEDVHERSRGD